MLAHDVVGDAGAPAALVFVHGILGSRNNWRAFAKKLVEQAPGWRAITVDLRNHGDSHGFAPPHTIDACAEDLRALTATTGADVVVGHSFGGKVALAYAAAGAEQRALAHTWILDAPPGPRALGGSDIERVLDVVRAIPLPVESRRALVDEAVARGLSMALAQWLTTSLREVERGFAWRFDVDAIPAMLASFAALDLWPVVEGADKPPTPGDRLHFVIGGRSDRFTAADRARLARTRAAVHVLERAGHWVHTDDPAGLLALLLPSLERPGDAS